MANNWQRDEVVAFEEFVLGVQDQEVMSRNVKIRDTDQTQMARSGDVIWVPQPSIAASYDGIDQTANFKAQTELSVPCTIGYEKSSPFTLDAHELRDALREGTLGKAAQQKLASDINKVLLTVISNQATVVVKRTVAATGFDDVALADAAFNETGVPYFDRCMALSSRDYNGMASNLAARGTMNTKPTNAYERAYVGNVAGFETFKLDYGIRLPAAAGSGLTISTLDAAVNYYIPAATSTAATTGQTSNVDNRYQRVTISATTGVVAGDCFTIAAVNSVHQVTKGDTGQLKTFRVISVDSATTMTISPPIISNQVASDAGTQYQNCVVNTKSGTSAIVWLNTAAATVNPFWQKDALQLIPGRYVVDPNSGVKFLRGRTESGVEVTMTKQFDIDTMKHKYRFDTHFGVTLLAPEMSGIVLFNQV